MTEFDPKTYHIKPFPVCKIVVDEYCVNQTKAPKYRCHKIKNAFKQHAKTVYNICHGIVNGVNIGLALKGIVELTKQVDDIALPINITQITDRQMNKEDAGHLGLAAIMLATVCVDGLTSNIGGRVKTALYGGAFPIIYMIFDKAETSPIDDISESGTQLSQEKKNLRTLLATSVILLSAINLGGLADKRSSQKTHHVENKFLAVSMPILLLTYQYGLVLTTNNKVKYYAIMDSIINSALISCKCFDMIHNKQDTEIQSEKSQHDKRSSRLHTVESLVRQTSYLGMCAYENALILGSSTKNLGYILFGWNVNVAIANFCKRTEAIYEEKINKKAIVSGLFFGLELYVFIRPALNLIEDETDDWCVMCMGVAALSYVSIHPKALACFIKERHTATVGP